MSLEKDFFSPVTRRRFLQYTGTAALSGSLLAACGGSTGGSGDKVKLTQWYHQYGEEGTQQAAKKYGKAYTQANIDVKWKAGDYGSQLNAAIASPNPPDIFEGSPNLDMVKNGLIEPLDDIIGPVKDDFNPVTLQSLTINGKVYAIKMLNDTGLLYYRKSMLEKAGVQPPTTMDEVIAATKKLTSGSVKGLFVGNDGGVGALQDIALWSAGGSYLDENNNVIFNNDRTVQAYEKVRELSKAGLLIGAPTDWWDPSAFTGGLVAMQWTGLWAMPAIKKALGDDFGVLPWPKLDDQGKPATFNGGWAAMVSAKGKHVKESKEFVKWLWIDNKEYQKDWNLAYGFHVPPRKSTAAEAEALKSGPAADAVKFLEDYGRSNPVTWAAGAPGAVTDALSNIVKTNVNVKQAIEGAAKKAETEIKNLLGK